MNDSDPPNRRWYQFIPVLGTRMNRARENRERFAAIDKAVAEIKKLGGRIDSKHVKRRSATWLEKLFGDPGDPDNPVHVLKFRRVTFIGGYNLTDTGLSRLKRLLKRLTNLRELFLTDTSVTDAGLEYLQGLTSLRYLDVSATKVTDDGVKKLQQALPNCVILVVSP
jgi:hypothetical protein